MTKRIMIVGASGLLGSRLVPLLQRSHEVIAHDRRTLDLSHPIDTAALPQRIDAVIYVAQSNRYREFPEGADEVLRITVEQPLALADYARCAGASHFVYASSGAVYGSGGAGLTEAAPTPPAGEALGFYAASKLAAEHLLGAYAPHLHVALLRYFFIYCAGQASGMLMPRIIGNVRDGRPVQLQGSEGLVINPVHAEDAARATAAALDLDTSEAVNVAGREELSLRRIAEIAGQQLGRAPQFDVCPVAEPAILTASTAKMAAKLCAPERSFTDGVREMINASGDAR